jgi:hypothetical protein
MARIDETTCHACGDEVIAPGTEVCDGQEFRCACGVLLMVSDYDEDGFALVRVEEDEE